MITNYTGAYAITSLFEQTGLTKFIISKVGDHKNKVPVFEYLEKGSVEKAISVFNKWAEIADSPIPYNMKLFNAIEDSQEIGEEVRNKKQGRILDFTFCLNKESNYNSEKQNNNTATDVNTIVENAILKLQKQHSESLLLSKIEALEKKLAEQEEEDDLIEDDEETLSGLNNPNITNLIGMLSGLFNKKPAAVNGTNDDVKLANINKAIKILAKYDNEIDTDLLKLASLAENNNVMFTTLLKTLRNF